MGKRYVFLWLVLICADQLTKYLAEQRGIIFRNYLFAFSTPLPQPIMYLVYLIILVVIGWYILTHHRNFQTPAKIAWTLIVAGSLSNVGERLVTGYVKDFIYLFSGVFNLADFYILFGIVLLFATYKQAKSETEQENI